MDVAYYILKCYDTGHKLKLSANIINMAYVRTYALNINCKIVINKQDISQWHLCMDDNVKCIRYAEWKKLK